MTQPSVPADEHKQLAIEVNRSFSPPLHEQAEVSEGLMTGVIAEWIADGLLVRSAPGKFHVPLHRANEWAALPAIAELVAQRIK